MNSNTKIGRNRRRGTMPVGRRAKCMHSLERHLKQHNRYDRKGVKTASYTTQANRRHHLKRVIDDLYAMGFKIPSVESLKGRHIDVLVKKWEKDNLSTSTIQGRLSHLRALCRWIGKEGMVLSATAYLVNPEKAKRSSVATKPKGCVELGVDVVPRLKKAVQLEPMVGVIILLQAAFGLRTEEASKSKPHLADCGDYLAVNWGTKGRRERTLAITLDVQRQTVDLAKQLTTGLNHSLIPTKYNWKQWRDRYYNVCKAARLVKAEGCNPHALRHSYAVMIFEAISGEYAPVKGLKPSPNADQDRIRLARQITAEHLGHSRMQKSSSYIGAMSECVFGEVT